MKIGIILLGFNRANHLGQVLAAVKAGTALPVLIHVDGVADGSIHAAANSEVKKLARAALDSGAAAGIKLRDENLGCCYGPVSGITWAFDEFDAVIVLEDDCLPDSTFFRFAVEMLERYRDDLRIGSVCGDNAYKIDLTGMPNSYCFTSYTRIWGWATWKNRWNKFDADCGVLRAMRAEYKILPELTFSAAEDRRLQRAIERILESKTKHIWDTQWWLTSIFNHWLCVQPRCNLIRNIGFGPGATHTVRVGSVFGRRRLEQMAFPLRHPSTIRPNLEFDRAIASQYTIYARLRRMAEGLFLGRG